MNSESGRVPGEAYNPLVAHSGVLRHIARLQILEFGLTVASGVGLASTEVPKTLTAKIEKVSYVTYGADYAWSFSVRISNPTKTTLAYCTRSDYYWGKIVRNGHRIATIQDPKYLDKWPTISVKDLALVRPGAGTTFEVIMGRGWFPKVERGQVAIVFMGEPDLNLLRNRAERNDTFAKFFKTNRAEMCAADFATNLIPVPTSATMPWPKS